MQLAYELTKHLGNLRNILNADLQSFKSIHGLGEVRYAQLQAAKEICHRSDFIHLQKEIRLSNTQQTYAFLKNDCETTKMKLLPHSFWITNTELLLMKNYSQEPSTRQQSIPDRL